MGIYLGIALSCLVGISLSVYAIVRIIRTLVFLNLSQKALGTVINWATAKNSDHQTTYLPVVEFRTTGNRVVQFTSTVASNPPAYKIGEQVEIRFLPKNPQIARVNSFSEIWLVTLVISLIALACFGIAFLLFQAR